MIKPNIKNFCLCAIFFSANLFSQVGVNTNSPRATLDIAAKTPTGAVNTGNDGLIVPRVDRARAQNMLDAEKATLIYVNNATTGTQTGKAQFIDSEGFYYITSPGGPWQKFNSSYTANNGLTLSSSNIKLGGALTGPTTISSVTTTNKLAVTGTGVDAINFANTLSVDATNNRVGVGTNNPTNKLHISGSTNPLRLENLTTGSVPTDNIMVVTPSGIVKEVGSLNSAIQSISVPTPALFKLNADLPDFLNNFLIGEKKEVPMSLVKNSIPGLTYNNSTNIITFPPGTYQMMFVYEGKHLALCDLSSYFVDFPIDGGLTRIHSTAYHKQNEFSNHGGSISFSTSLSATTSWPINMGVGQSGTCIDPSQRLLPGFILKNSSTHLLIFRIGN